MYRSFKCEITKLLITVTDKSQFDATLV